MNSYCCYPWLDTDLQTIASKLSKRKAVEENMRITRQLLDELVSPKKSPHASDESDEPRQGCTLVVSSLPGNPPLAVRFTMILV